MQSDATKDIDTNTEKNVTVPDGSPRTELPEQKTNRVFIVPIISVLIIVVSVWALSRTHYGEAFEAMHTDFYVFLSTFISALIPGSIIIVMNVKSLSKNLKQTRFRKIGITLNFIMIVSILATLIWMISIDINRALARDAHDALPRIMVYEDDKYIHCNSVIIHADILDKNECTLQGGEIIKTGPDIRFDSFRPEDAIYAERSWVCVQEED